ncbi:MAG: hypothetical protein SOU51_01545, partial [Collinsella sp.]|nr:hypothetical protein [Collinsella sp.]
HVVLDPNIGAIEGGMLQYAERAFVDSNEFTMSIWSYSNDSIGINDEFGLERASQRVVIGAESSLLYVTDNGSAITGLEGITATASDGTEYSATEWLDGSHVGYYRFAQDLPAGTYAVSFGPDYETGGAAKIEVPEDGLSIFAMDFHSVGVKDSEHARTWLVKPSTGERVSSLDHVLHGAKVKIGTEVDDSICFIGYEATGTAPEWEDGDASRAEQSIAVLGDATIRASVAACPPTDPGSPSTPDPKKPDSSALPATGDSMVMISVAAMAMAGCAALALAARRSER